MDAFKLLFSIFYLINFIYIARGNAIIETKSGKVAGIKIQSIIKDEIFHSFYSIPYAEPPVDANRFMPPVPHPGWDDILENKKEKKPCAHYNMPLRDIPVYGYSGNEDCLYLSIHTPKLPNNDDLNLPVIVFLFNEHFKIAYNASKEYGPDFFMKEDVIIVTIQHRLGPLGFLSFEDDLIPGNNGIKDVVLALKWLHSNIDKFGGNPKKITLMGNEGGAVIVDVLLHSPRAKGLFSAAILQSGTSWNSMFLNPKGRERAIELSKVLEEHATTSSYLLKRLSNVNALKITEKVEIVVHADEARTYQRGIIPFGPIVEHDHPDAIITEFPENKPIDIEVPVMIGYNSREGIELSGRYLHRPMFLTFADRDFVFLFPYRVNHYFDFPSKIHDIALQEIKDFYFDEGYIKINVAGEYISYMQDLLVFYPIDYTVRKYTNNTKSPVYYYMFDYSGDFNLRKQNILKEAKTIDGTWGASTGDELCYLFVCKPLKKAYKKALSEEDSEEITVMKNMVKLWSNFAKTGNPTPPDEEFQWKPATHENKECLVISDELEMKTKLHDKVVSFWDQFLEKYANLAVDGIIRDVKDEL